MPPIIDDWQIVVPTLILEAGKEDLQGMTMVAEVIRDRTKNKYNSNGTVHNTVFRPLQFSCWNTEIKIRGDVLRLDLAHPSVQKAIYAYNDAFYNGTNFAMGANLYHADYMDPYPAWTFSSNVKRLTHHGHHIFYKEER